jgi:hypothetical protein
VAGRFEASFAAFVAFSFSASACASAFASPRKCLRTASACELSMELECVFFSVTPTAGK